MSLNYPSFQQIAAAPEVYRALLSYLEEQLSKVDYAAYEERLAQEGLAYGQESRSKRLARARDSTQWTLVDPGETETDLVCASEGDCWYQGNLDRRSSYQGYRLVGGPPDFVVCDVCLNNHLELLVDAHAELLCWDLPTEQKRKVS